MGEENRTYVIPEEPQGLGAVQDGERAFIFGFQTHREVFRELGYLAVPEDDRNLKRCADALCDLLYMQAILKAMTVSQEELLALLSEEDRACEACERNAAIVLTAVRQAVTDYAGKRNAPSA